MTIEHLVLAGGGLFGFQVFGSLQESAKDGFWNPSEIKSIWGTSAGSILAVTIALGFEWSVIEDFLIRRPWHTLFPIDLDTIVQGYTNRGLLNKYHFIQVFAPLFNALDIQLDISLQGFYEWTKERWPPHGIELHMFSMDINQDYSVDVDFNHRDYPHVPLLDAVYASCSIPGVFSPLLTPQGSCYLDGGALANFPIEYLLKTNPDPKTVFGIDRDASEHVSGLKITHESNLIHLYSAFITKIGERINHNVVDLQHATILRIPTSLGGVQALFDSLKSPDERRKLIESGAHAWKLFKTSLQPVEESLQVECDKDMGEIDKDTNAKEIGLTDKAIEFSESIDSIIPCKDSDEPFTMATDPSIVSEPPLPVTPETPPETG